LGLGITHLNLLENNVRPNRDYESNPVMRIIAIILSPRRGPRAQRIRDQLVVSIDINHSGLPPSGAGQERHRKRENHYACNESGTIQRL
jgi:hypothetical protein